MIVSVPHSLERKRGLILSLLIIGILTVLAIFSGPTEATDKRTITVYADGRARTISSAVTDVATAIEKAGVDVGDKDLVEPSLDTEIIDSIFRINIYRARPVTVVDGDTTEIVMSPYQSARLIAKDAGIKVYPEDKFVVERINDILVSGTIGQRLTIIRATKVNINLYGSNIVHRTHSETVADALEEKGIFPDPSDVMEPSLDTAVEHDMNIALVQVGRKVKAIKKVIAHDTQVIQDSNKLVGVEVVKTAGVDGVRLNTFDIKLENNKEISRKLVQSVVTKKPVTEVLVVGTKIPDASSNVAIGQMLAAKRGWAGDQWQCLYKLWDKESHWNHLAENPSSGAYGIPQSLPGSKMAAVSSDWRTNPETQIKWGLNYIAGRYGSPCAAWNHSVINNWY